MTADAGVRPIETPLRLLILGASGRCGRWAVRLAAEAGHRVTALVRPETAYEPPAGVDVVRGSAFDWVAPRPVTLVDSAPTRRTRTLRRYGVVSVIGRADVAAWLLRAAADPAPVVERTPMIGWW